MKKFSKKRQVEFAQQEQMIQSLIQLQFIMKLNQLQLPTFLQHLLQLEQRQPCFGAASPTN